MSLPRLVVVDGPDVGAEFPVGPGGGGIGRGEGNVVQLSDLGVSRSHCMVRVDGDKLTLVDAGSRNRTLVNGRPITEHVLAEGDEISIGKTRLCYLPADGGVAVVPSQRSFVTLEVNTGDLLRARLPSRMRISRPVEAQVDPQAERARRHLGSLARLGDGLRRAADRGAVTRLACEVAREALDADRAFLLLRESTGRMAPVASAVVPQDPAGAQLSLPRDLLDRCLQAGNAVVAAPEGAARTILAAPMGPAEGTEQPPGLLVVDRRSGGERAAPEAWTEPDLQLAACIAQLAAAALDGLSAREALARENRALEERLAGSREFVGEGTAARSVLAFVGKVAPTDSTVLLLGESGAGKEMVASAIHYASRRSRGPFVCVNCAALTETLLESELFGHEKGAFTGATERKLGRFELADGGTLFLDEVGELSAKCQTKFLRVLEERRFERVGGQRPIATDVRVIAATNRNLSEMVRKNEFREDLYYRLSVIQTEIPPLRARREDIPALADHFLARLRFQTGRRVAGFTPDALRAMMAYGWPGNVRELRNAVERALVLGEGDLIRMEDLPPQIAEAAPATSPPTAPSAFAVPARAPAPAPYAAAPPAAAPPPPVYAPYAPLPTPAVGIHIPTPVAGMPAVSAPTPGARSLRELEKEGILAALAATRGNKAQAAAILEIDRSTLYKKLKEYGIEP